MLTRREEVGLSIDTWSAPEWECNGERRGVTRRQRGSRVGERKRQMYRCLGQLEGLGWGEEQQEEKQVAEEGRRGVREEIGGQKQHPT